MEHWVTSPLYPRDCISTNKRTYIFPSHVKIILYGYLQTSMLISGWVHIKHIPCLDNSSKNIFIEASFQNRENDDVEKFISSQFKYARSSNNGYIRPNGFKGILCTPSKPNFTFNFRILISRTFNNQFFLNTS